MRSVGMKCSSCHIFAPIVHQQRLTKKPPELRLTAAIFLLFIEKLWHYQNVKLLLSNAQFKEQNRKGIALAKQTCEQRTIKKVTHFYKNPFLSATFAAFNQRTL